MDYFFRPQLGQMSYLPVLAPSKLHILRARGVNVSWMFTSKIGVHKDVSNSKFGEVTSPGETALNIRTQASPKWNRTRCQKEFSFSIN